MTHHLFHVGFMFPGVPKVRDLEPIFGSLGDWIRYSQTGWLLWSETDNKAILAALCGGIDDNDLVVLTRLDDGNGGFSGKLQPWMWQWVRSKLSGIVLKGEPGFYLPPPA